MQFCLHKHYLWDNHFSMKKLIRLFSFLFIACLSFKANAQFTATGSVIDSSTREALAGASVFCQNTTLGTVTNKQGEFSLQLKSGGYDLIISYTGYQTQQVRISGNDNNKLEISLVKEDKSLGEVVIRSSNEVKDGWEKYGDFFIKNFNYSGHTPTSQY